MSQIVTLTARQVETIASALATIEWESNREAENTAEHPDPGVPGWWRERAAMAADAYAALRDAPYADE